MKFSASSLTLLLAVAVAVAPTAIQGMLSNECKSDLADMYDMSSLTYQTIHETSVMASMNDELETPEGSVYYTFNGNQEALATFQEKCQGYKQLSTATATATATATTTNSTNMNTTSMVMISGRVTRLSLMNSCTEDYSIGLPACVPTSCGTDHENDVEIATALSDLLTDEDCVSVFSPTGESISSACLLDVVNTTSPAMAMSMSMAMAGCEMNNDTATATRTAIDVSFENICGGNVTQVLEEIYCVPSSCESSEAVSELFQGHLVKITPYVDTMEMSNGTVTGTGTAGNETVPAAECEWVYKDPSFELRNGTKVDVDTNTTDTSTNGTVADEEEFDFDCVEYSKMTHGSKSSKNESSSSSKSSKNESSSGSKSKSKKTKSSCKKSAKGGSLRRTKAPAMPRQSIDSSDLKIRSWNPLGLNRN